MDYVVKRPTSAPPEVKEELEETKVQFVLFVLHEQAQVEKGGGGNFPSAWNLYNSNSRDLWDFASTPNSKNVLHHRLNMELGLLILEK